MAVGAAGGLVAVGAAAGAVVAVGGTGVGAGGLVAVGGTGVAVGVAPQAASVADTAVRADSFKKSRRPNVFSDMFGTLLRVDSCFL